ncbi:MULTISPECIES: hypothetical protein [Rhizobium]|uniref:hypothetical protein n=1 Tax=Rhizobium TaxID=379 RepID=UPI001440E5CB|nr:MULTISPECIES: hypothetical protein [Rhizobium]MCH4548508.1 type VI secretion protein [Rhizobium changzhiense]NKL08006.1 hypothetical protein [Rhizobium leguminosarum bv. viciae]NKL87497.1 hypothetical protein [Rhizobium leguminosarum bv. viciae]NKL90423.1 hypothetical protein [Rhizobium leguminosarum bv. viciae]
MKIVVLALLGVVAGGTSDAFAGDVFACRKIADGKDRLNCYDELFGAPSGSAKQSAEGAEISWTDLQVDYNEMKGKTVTTSGKFLFMGEQGLLYDRQMGMTAFFVNVQKLPRDQRSLLYSNCGTGCDVRLTGKVEEIMMQRGITATRVTLD